MAAQAPDLFPRPPARLDKPTAPGVQKVSHRHDMIMTWIMANPTQPLSQVATEFSVTQAWLSQVIHSDAFQERLRERQDLFFHHTLKPLEEKLKHLAHRTLDKMSEHVEMGTIPIDELRKTTDQTLKALGYGVKPSSPSVQQNVQQNFYQVESSTLSEARQRIGRKSTGDDSVLITQESQDVRSDASVEENGQDTSAEFQTGGASRVGSTCTD
jgi:hypothetical protein